MSKSAAQLLVVQVGVMCGGRILSYFSSGKHVVLISADRPTLHLDCSPARSSPDPVTSETPTSRGHRSHQLLKTHSMGSISSESLTISSLWDTPSYDTIPDFLSSLGFDDFDSPELIPDR